MQWIAELLFYPTLYWNIALNKLIPRQRRWWDWIDDDVLLGALPLAMHVSDLQKLGIRAVINTCREYCGPLDAYQRAGIEQLHLPTTDFTPPAFEDVARGVEFIRKNIGSGRKVYVHCKAGRARSATIVICYLIAKGVAPEQAQKLLLEKRPHVHPALLERQVVKEFIQRQTMNDER